MAQSSCEIQKSAVNQMTQRAICMDAAEAFIGNNTSIDKQCWRDVATSIGLNKDADLFLLSNSFILEAFGYGLEN